MTGIVETGIATALANPEAAEKLFDSVVKRIGRVVKGPAKALALKSIAALQSYQPYLEETNDRVASFKTFSSPTQPVSVLDHFVTTEFEANRTQKILTQDDILDKIIRPSRIVISAIAGYGKSMVMRYIALSLYESPRGRIPIFIELRHLNRMENPNLLAYIHSTYKRISQVQIEHLKQGLLSGAFVLLLDGFDELNHEIRPIIESQIIELSSTYSSCSIVVSGRPNNRFSSWRNFSILKIRPMRKENIIELIGKLDYDKGVKKRFVAEIKKGLYEAHVSFLSTPLLAILMLLTYEKNASIPDKMHLFYSQAFETLFHKHDALKEQYNRSRKSELQIDEFQKVFSVFCLKSYILEKTEFTKVELTTLLREALEFESHKIDPENMFFDVEEAVCLIMNEGQSYFFVHRSFQEYFTAVFLSSCNEETRDNFIDNIGHRYWDNVLTMLFDISSAQIEPTWVKRNTDKYLDAVSVSGDEDKMSPLQAKFSGLGFFRHSGRIHLARMVSGPFSQYLSAMGRFYPILEDMGHSIDFDRLESATQSGSKDIGRLLSDVDMAEKGGKISIRNLTWGDLPETILRGTNLEDHTIQEYHAISQIRENISDSIVARSEFLKKLFPIMKRE